MQALRPAGFTGLPRRDSRLLGLAVLALHALVAVLLWQIRWTAPPRPVREPLPLMLRLLWPSPPPQEPAPPRPPAHAVKPPPTATPAAPVAAPPAASPRLDTSAAITLPAAEALPPDTAASRPLDLQYHGSATASPSLVGRALNDPRANTHSSFSERFTSSLHADTGHREERMAEGYRVHDGGHCYRVHDNRMNAVDPIGQSTSYRPRGVESCD